VIELTDPRRLEAGEEEQVPSSPERAEELETALRTFEELGSTFATPGWEHLVRMLEGHERTAENALCSTAGVRSMEEVLGLRARLDLVRWLLALPEKVAGERAAAITELQDLEPKED